MDDAYYTGLAAAYARGMLPDASGNDAVLIEAGRAAGLKLHRFKRTAELPRVRAREFLRAEKNFVWNATNLSRRIRGGLIDLFADYGARVRIAYLEAPEGEQRRRNAARRNPVPEAALGRMLDNWVPPKINEAHHVEWISSTR
jgi:predicted kinase